MNRSVAVFLCMLWLGLTPPAASSAPKILTGGGAGEVMRTVPLSPAILSQTGRKVSLSGFYYGGSVPMIIDDISRTDYNMELPEGSFIPLEGPPSGRTEVRRQDHCCGDAEAAGQNLSPEEFPGCTEDFRS
ncbi:hypothetical protein [Aminivibrio sp.]|uniref:hypothetical protein n=1 Tax=Aminivibrio sp. TaxID=1872489 RepID=UPI003D9633FD